MNEFNFYARSRLKIGVVLWKEGAVLLGVYNTCLHPKFLCMCIQIVTIKQNLMRFILTNKCILPFVYTRAYNNEHKNSSLGIRTPA